MLASLNFSLSEEIFPDNHVRTIQFYFLLQKYFKSQLLFIFTWVEIFLA